MKNHLDQSASFRPLLLLVTLFALTLVWLALAASPLLSSPSTQTTATPTPSPAPATELERLRAAFNDSEARRLAAQARLLYQTDWVDMSVEGKNLFEQALLLSVQAVKRVENDETRDTLLSALDNRFAFTFHYTSIKPVQIAYSEAANRVAVGNRTGEINLIEFPSGKNIGQPLLGHEGNFTALQFSPDGKILASGSRNGSVRFWDVATGQMRSTVLTGHTDRVLTLAFSPDNQTLITSGLDKTLRRWNLATGQPIGEPVQLESGIGGILFSPDGKSFATGDGRERVLLGTVAGGQLTPLGAAGAPAAYSPDGTLLAVSGGVPVLQVWDIPNGKQLYNIPYSPEFNSLTGVFFNADEQTLTVIASPADIRVYDARTGEQRYTRYFIKPAGTYTMLLMQGGTVFSSYSDIPGFWNLPQDHVWHTGIGLAARGANDARFSPDGKWLAAERCTKPGYGASCNGYTLKLLDVVSHTPVDALILPDGSELIAFAFNPDSSQLALSLCHAFDDRRNCTQSEIVVWDLAAKKFTSNPIRTAQPASKMRFTLNGKNLVTSDSTNAITMWDLATGVAIGAPLTGHTDFISAMAISPDGKVLATGSPDKTLRFWDLVNHNAAQVLTGHTGPVYDVQFSPDGKTVASASGDGTIRLWNVANGQPIGAPWVASAPASATDNSLMIPPTSLAFSSNGKFLAAGQDDTISLWDVAQAKLLRRWNVERGVETTLPTNLMSLGGLGTLTFQSNDTQLWTVTRSGTIRQIDLAKLLASPIERACARLNRNLTADEWNQYLANGIDTYENYRAHPTCPNALVP